MGYLDTLIQGQKYAHKRTAKEVLQHYKTEGERFLNNIVVIDKTWIQNFKLEMKSQSS